MPDHAPCCTACGGHGGDYSVPCWSCQGTGCDHPPDTPTPPAVSLSGRASRVDAAAVSAERIDFAAVKAEHALHCDDGNGRCLYTAGINPRNRRPCLIYRLAVEAKRANEDARDQRARAIAAEVRADGARVEVERLAGKVARVVTWEHEWFCDMSERMGRSLDAALADRPEQEGPRCPVCHCGLPCPEGHDQPEQVQPTVPAPDPGRPAVGVCSRKGCGRPWSEHEHGMFCP